MWCFLLLTLFVTVQGRAVNISNTWVLPEEGFPVFYRYFRDRISWYEADAVCQFHHANLVTVDTTAQYDAVRAYLKELDISSAVWVGLIRSNPDGDFTWTDYRGLSGDGYWSAAPDTRSAPLCAAADPAADYRWEARACGGPSVASFICELPVPQWALGNEGCMVRELPALTVLYLPESAAVQLTADCGLAGVKRVQCTGNVKREELLKELACTEEDQTSPTLNGTSPITSWQITTDSLFTNQDNSNNEASTEENVTTEHEDDINQSTSLKVISTSFSIIPDTSNKITLKPSVMDKTYKIPLQKNIDMVYSNDLKNNETPQIVHNDDLFTNEQHGKQDNDKILQRTKLHDELARLGNLDTIFSQPTDHFVPPLVMAKAKISEDMTALSIEEKLAQKVSERQLKQDIQQDFVVTANHLNKLYRTETINSTSTTALPLINLITSTKGSNNEQSVNKMSPKKYKNKYNDMKQKILKNSFPKSINSYEPVQTTPILTKLSEENTNTTSTMKTITEQPYFDEYQTKSQSIGDTSLELTVIIKETIANQSTDGNIVPTHSPLLINISINKSNIKDDETGFTSTTSTVDPPSTFDIKKEDLIDVNIFNDENKHSDPIPEIITSIPAFEGSLQSSEDNVTKDSTLKKSMTVLSLLKSINSTPNIVESTATTVNSRTDNISTNTAFQVNSNVFTNSTDEFSNDLNINDSVVNASKTDDISDNVVSSSNGAIKEGFDTIIDADFDLEKNITDSSSEIDDFQSPLLSGANDPLPKPNRSRRLQQQPRIKFNPFRILG